MVKHGANLNYKDKYGRSALIQATEFGQLSFQIARDCIVFIWSHISFGLLGYHKIVEMLVDGGSDVNAQDENGKTAVFVAGSKGEITICSMETLKLSNFLIQDFCCFES